MKRLVIFSTIGGGGHTSVAYALNELLHEQYAIKTINIFSQVLGIIDPIKLLSLGYCSAENLYNSLLVQRYNRLVNMLYAAGRLVAVLAKPLIVFLVRRCLAQENPDCVISLVPIINGAIQSACQQAGISFLLIPTDLDPRTFIHGIKAPYQRMCIVLPFNDPMIMDLLKDENSAGVVRKGIGFCLKKSFFAPKDLQQIKSDFSVPSDKPIIMLLMGAVGAELILEYLKQFAAKKEEAHILVCIGRNSALQQEIAQIVFPLEVTITIIGLTDRIADLLAIADIFITKPGTVSVVEGIYSGVPMLIDATSTPLAWEAFNIEFIEKHHFGSAVRSFDELSDQLKRLLCNHAYYAGTKHKLKHFTKPLFGMHINTILSELMQIKRGEAL